MLNFWKTIQSKKSPTASADINNVGLSLSSNGLAPLKDFEYSDNGTLLYLTLDLLYLFIEVFNFSTDLYALEKCRLSLHFGEALILDNSTLLSMFRQFLDHRNCLTLYNLYMGLLGRTDIEDEQLRQNLLRNISVHRIHFSDQLMTRIHSNSEHIDIGDLKEVTDRVHVVLQEYV